MAAQKRPKRSSKHKGATKNKGATKRKQPILWWRVVKRAIAIVCVAGFVAAAPVLLSKVDFVIDVRILPIEKISMVNPLKYQADESVLNITNLALGKSLLWLDLDELRRNLEDLPWLDEVGVRRKWPDTLLIEVTEYEPIANWNDTQMINVKGFPLEKPKDTIELASLYGPSHRSKDVIEYYLIFSEMFSSHDFYVSDVTMKPRGSVSVVLNDDVKIVLGDQNVIERSHKIVRLLTSGRFPNDQIEYLDARYQNGIAIKMKNQESTKVGA